MRNSTALASLTILLLLGVFILQTKNHKNTLVDNSWEKTFPWNQTASSGDTIETGLTIDYSSLGKDRLYTEEEGRYENLNDEEKKIVRLAFSSMMKDSEEADRMAGNPSQSKSMMEETIVNSKLLSLKNGLALVQYPTVKAAFFYILYDEKNNRTMLGQFSNIVFSESALVLIDPQSIAYYKPGMTAVGKIADSDLAGNETYLKFEGFGNEVIVTFVSQNSIKASIFDRTKILADRTFKKIAEREFLVEK